jgi:prophage antirepressor-like protein
MNTQAIKLFETKKVRTVWNENEEEWYFSIQDIVEALTDTVDVKDYIKKMKKRDTELSFNWGTICPLVEMIAADGKKRKIQASNTQGVFRIIQSIPSPKAEPFKQWLAYIAKERLDQMQAPELSIEQAMLDYKRLGYSDNWINQRLKSIEVRKELTDEWEQRGVKQGQEFAVLTDIITQAWSGKSVKQYKQYKGLKKESLRDNMTNLELVLNMLAEATTTEISKEKEPKTFAQNREIAQQGGKIASNTRKQIETKTGKKVVTPLSAKNVLSIDSKKNKL